MMIEALGVEIAELKRKGSTARIALTGGERLRD
jgi:hypothetical protein